MIIREFDFGNRITIEERFFRPVSSSLFLSRRTRQRDRPVGMRKSLRKRAKADACLLPKRRGEGDGIRSRTGTRRSDR